MAIRYAVLHMLVDGLCALAMFGTFLLQKNGYFYIFLYNFCAFALQMPFGVMLDLLCAKFQKGKTDWPFLTVLAGVVCTIIGAATHPAVLGIGNALFHVGGGVGTIREDREKNYRGRGLGIFVAPGAPGLYLGTLAAESRGKTVLFTLISFLMLFLCCGILYKRRCSIGFCRPASGAQSTEAEKSFRGYICLSVCCLAVVMLRSYIGMAVTFSWKTGIAAGMAAVLAIVGGKAAGGFFAAGYGCKKTVIVSLLAAAVCYLYSEIPAAGILALFLFNMTMPVTLYLMICRLPQMPGFAFGFLTFALFLGFLPKYFQWQPVISSNILGCMGSIISLTVLAAGIYAGGRDGSISY